MSSPGSTVSAASSRWCIMFKLFIDSIVSNWTTSLDVFTWDHSLSCLIQMIPLAQILHWLYCVKTEQHPLMSLPGSTLSAASLRWCHMIRFIIGWIVSSLNNILRCSHMFAFGLISLVDSSVSELSFLSQSYSFTASYSVDRLPLLFLLCELDPHDLLNCVKVVCRGGVFLFVLFLFFATLHFRYLSIELQKVKWRSWLWQVLLWKGQVNSQPTYTGDYFLTACSAWVCCFRETMREALPHLPFNFSVSSLLSICPIIPCPSSIHLLGSV